MIKDFTYHVVRHDRIGIVGPNGVGKSTFMNILDGTYEATKGTIGKGETFALLILNKSYQDLMKICVFSIIFGKTTPYMVLGDGSTLSAGQILERFLLHQSYMVCRFENSLAGNVVVYTLLKLLDERP